MEQEAERVSGRHGGIEVGGTGEGGGEGAGGGEDCDGEHSGAEGKKEKGRWSGGDKVPASSLSISLSNFTSPGGSTPHLEQRFDTSMSVVAGKIQKENNKRQSIKIKTNKNIICLYTACKKTLRPRF